MKHLVLKLVSLSLVLVMIFACVSVTASAITWDKVPETNYAGGYWSSYYTYGKYYKNLTQIPLTGDQRRDTVAVAMSQANYLEGDSIYDQDGETGGSSNYTEYGSYTNVNGAAWCASFCSWAFYTAGCTSTRGTESYMARNGYYWAECYVPYWSNMLYDNGRYQYSYYYGGSYQPQPGDLVFFPGAYTPLDEAHIGMVVYADSSYVYTIEGNTSGSSGVDPEGGGVFYKQYDLWSSSLGGFGRMPYSERSDLPAIDYSGANPTPGLYINPMCGKSVYFLRDDTVASWWLPISSVFEVLKIEQDNQGYTMLYSKCEIDGTTVYGWIVHDTSYSGKTLQIYAATDTTPELESNTFEIGSDNTVAGILPGATVSSLLSGVSSSDSATTVKIYKGNTAVANSATLATGMTVKIFDGNEEVNSYDIVVKGDVNGDGKITGMDYMLAKRHVLGASALSGAYKKAAAVNGGTAPTSNDYITLKRVVLGTYTLK